MTITKSIAGNEAVLKLEGWLDTQASSELTAAIEEIDEGIETVTFDMSGLEYISSSGVRQVVAVHKKYNGRLTLTGVNDNILNVFKAIGIDKKIRIENL